MYTDLLDQTWTTLQQSPCKQQECDLETFYHLQAYNDEKSNKWSEYHLYDILFDHWIHDRQILDFFFILYNFLKSRNVFYGPCSLGNQIKSEETYKHGFTLRKKRKIQENLHTFYFPNTIRNTCTSNQ